MDTAGIAGLEAEVRRLQEQAKETSRLLTELKKSCRDWCEAELNAARARVAELEKRLSSSSLS